MKENKQSQLLVIPGTLPVIPGLTRDLPPWRAGFIEQEIAGVILNLIQDRNDKKSACNDKVNAHRTNKRNKSNNVCIIKTKNVRK